jgi:hypothetical protein
LTEGEENRMVLADFGVAFVIVTGLITVGAIIVRSQYRRRHPPLTMEEKTARLEQDLADVNEQIGKIEEWDT